uniref:HD protein 5 n=1 Tax=Auricularia cornea TaxID=1238391 RepID=A0A8K2AUU2_9AGAM|nr:HD protein 5 [Auricularia cornea]
MCFILERFGLFVDSQTVGRWFGQRAKREAGLPHQQSKTPAQSAMLEESFTADPYPDSTERMRLVRGTLLSKSQVDAWFSVQRKKRTDEVEAHGYVIEPGTRIADMRVPPEVSGELRRAWKEVEKERQEALRRLAEEEQEEDGEEH